MTIKILAVSLMLAGLATPASAHAFLQHASPAAGDTLTGAPAQVDLEFTKPLDPKGCGIEVTDEAGHEMDAAPVTVDGADMRVALKPLAAGRYHLSWRVLSTDTHETEGSFNFTVMP